MIHCVLADHRHATTYCLFFKGKTSKFYRSLCCVECIVIEGLWLTLDITSCILLYLSFDHSFMVISYLI